MTASRAGVALVALAAILVASCAPTPPRAPRAPRSAEELLPADLDLVVRVDLAKMRRALGEEGWSKALARALDDQGVDAGRAPLERSITEGARSVTFGFRGEGRADLVVVATGDFSALPPALLTSGAWVEVSTQEVGTRAFERPTTEGARARAAPVWIYVARDIVAFASAAEADGLRRVAFGAADVGRLEPPADGVLGFAARVRQKRLAGLTVPGLDSVASDLSRVSGGVDVEGGAVRAEANLVFRDKGGADRADHTLRILFAALSLRGRGPARQLAQGVTIVRPEDRTLALRVVATGATARELLGSSGAHAPEPLGSSGAYAPEPPD